MNHNLIVFGHLHICSGTSTGQEPSCMNKCEGAFSLHRSMLSPAEREVRLVSLQKDGLSQLLWPENPEVSPRCCPEWWGRNDLYPPGLLWRLHSSDFQIVLWVLSIWVPRWRRGEGIARLFYSYGAGGGWNSGNFFFRISKFCKQYWWISSFSSISKSYSYFHLMESHLFPKALKNRQGWIVHMLPSIGTKHYINFTKEHYKKWTETVFTSSILPHLTSLNV